VQVLDFSTTPTGEPFLAMEFLEGEDLEHRLRRDKRLSAPRVIHVVKQVASALAATHGKAIVHRDLKPGNIFLLEAAGETDFVKVLDFGISKMRMASTKLTRTSSIMGSPNYMSPEQAMGRVEDVDERTDQWALACIVWECLAGEGPFVGENVPSILFRIVHEPPPSLLAKVAGLAPAVEEVLLRALAKDKNERFPGVTEFAAALEIAVEGASPVLGPMIQPTARLVPTALDAAPEKPAAPSTTFTRTAGELGDDLDVPVSWPRKWAWALAAGGVVALLLVAFLLLRPSPVSKPVSATPPPAAPPPAAPSPVPPPPAAPVPAAPPPFEAERDEPRVEAKSAASKSVPLPEATGQRPGTVRRTAKKPMPSKKPDEENTPLWH
jgi:serine/threonine-protein kinase